MSDDPTKPRFKLGDVIRARSVELLDVHPLPTHVRKVFIRMESCGTGENGYNLLKCPREECAALQWAPRGCTDRHCPSCGRAKAEAWVLDRDSELLDCEYFHIVCTLPSQLRDLVLENPRELLDLLMRAVRETLLELGADPKYLGGTPSLIQVVHTWNQRLDFHPHVHCVISGAALDPQGRLVRTKNPEFLFPFAVIASLFRGKFLAGLKQLRDREELSFSSMSNRRLVDAGRWKAFVDKLYRIKWHVYAKRPFGGPRQVVAYLARYTHRTAISNSRILDLDLDRRLVKFSYKDRKAKKRRTRTMDIDAFVLLFSTHILPAGFHRTRLAGLLAPTKRELLARAIELSGRSGFVLQPGPAPLPHHKRRCAHCKIGLPYVVFTIFSARPTLQDWITIRRMGATGPPDPKVQPR